MEWEGAVGSHNGNIINHNPNLVDPENGDYRSQGFAEGYGCQIFNDSKDNFQEESINGSSVGNQFLSSALESITVSGNITQNTTWNADTVKVIGDVTVDNGITLTVTEGTQVVFQNSYSLTVDGRILAEGSSDKMIAFRNKDSTGFFSGAEGSFWKGIVFEKTSADNDSSLFKYCIFENGRKVGKKKGVGCSENRGGAISVSNFSKLKIINCIFRDNMAELGGAIYLYQNSSVAISGNLFYNNTAVENGTVMAVLYSYPQITYNTIIENRLLNEDVFNQNLSTIFSYISKPKFCGNIIRNNPNIMDQQLAHNKLYYTEYNNITGILDKSGNIDLDPGFVDASLHDYSLSESSVCINAGSADNSLIYITAEDLAGNERVFDEIIDMGAYEFIKDSKIDPSGIGDDSVLLQNYPNPFNPVTTICYTLTTKASVKIMIVNSKGQKVWERGTKIVKAGRHSLIFDGSGLNSGIYFYAIEVEGIIKDIKKMILVK